MYKFYHLQIRRIYVTPNDLEPSVRIQQQITFT